MRWQDALELEREEAQAVLTSHVADPISCAMCGPAQGRWPCSAVFLARTVLMLISLVEQADRTFPRGYYQDVWTAGADFTVTNSYEGVSPS